MMAWWKTAQPGDPVVCVDAREVPDILQEGQIYLIADLLLNCPHYITGELGIALALQNVPSPPQAEYFGVHRFRPAQSTDLPAALTQLLDQPVSEKLKVGA